MPTLGHSANLSEPWAPRKDTSRSFVYFLQTFGAKHSKAKCSNSGPKHRRPQNYVGRRSKMEGVRTDGIKKTLFGHEPLI